MINDVLQGIKLDQIITYGRQTQVHQVEQCRRYIGCKDLKEHLLTRVPVKVE